MRCTNCGANKIYAERPYPHDDTMIYHETITMDSDEQSISYKLKNRRIIRAFTQHPEVSIWHDGDDLVLKGHPGLQVVVNFSIGR